ncbi:Aste57867_24204 [Aphanomyces stellatus]|uniref:Aste57867_24204 protein n=1 Tax=Aphanomyces stellatus TaxID=120398 RepID=A0A485LPV8_9STRA|nr:hypothetical protein As57867_024130 [Aphanomyces stellatus]VFU00846.1 Aste57867_24204 [Aphanomyces stellatus]
MFSFLKNDEEKNEDRREKILKAATEGDLARVKQQVKKDATLMTCKNGDGCTPLYKASEKGDLAVVEFLVASGASMNQTKNFGSTPLHYASPYGHLAVVQFLVASGANINQANHNRGTPLHSASENGHLAVVQLLVASGANIDQADREYEQTPLIVAADNGRLDVVRVLVNAGASLALSDTNGKTALNIAFKVGYWEIVEYFDEIVSKLRAPIVPMLTANEIHDALATLNRYVPPTGWPNALDLAWRAAAYMCAGDKESARKDARASIQLDNSEACSTSAWPSLLAYMRADRPY